MYNGSSLHRAFLWRAREVPGSSIEIFHVSILSSWHTFLLLKVFLIFKHSETRMEITLLHEYLRFFMKITHGILLELRKVANKIRVVNEDIFLA
jgi:hypothetical protein